MESNVWLKCWLFCCLLLTLGLSLFSGSIRVKETKKSDNRDGKEETHLRGFRRITWISAPVNLGIREREELRMTLTFLACKFDAQFCLWLIKKTRFAILPQLTMLQPCPNLLLPQGFCTCGSLCPSLAQMSSLSRGFFDGQSKAVPLPCSSPTSVLIHLTLYPKLKWAPSSISLVPLEFKFCLGRGLMCLIHECIPGT